MSELTNPHDRFFKEVFSRPEAVADFLTHYLPAEVANLLDLGAPELLKDSFVDKDLQTHFSDLLYRVRLKNGEEAFACLLFEHKSWPDEFTAFQVLRYKVRIWEQKLREGAKRLPLILPIVLYHGRARWQADTNFQSLIESGNQPALQKYVPGFEYFLCDLSALKEEEIKGAALLRVGLSLLKHIFSEDLPQRLMDIFAMFHQMQEQSALEFLQTVLKYLSIATDRVTKVELKRVLTSTFSEKEGGLMQTLAEQWIQEGLQQGLQQGLLQGVTKITLKMLRRKLGELNEWTQTRISSLPSEQLDQLSEDLLDLNTIDDLEAWLDVHEPQTERPNTQIH